MAQGFCQHGLIVAQPLIVIDALHERMFGKLKRQHRIATRYDKTVLSFERFLNLAAARLWLKAFVNTA